MKVLTTSKWSISSWISNHTAKQSRASLLQRDCNVIAIMDTEVLVYRPISMKGHCLCFVCTQFDWIWYFTTPFRN